MPSSRSLATGGGVQEPGRPRPTPRAGTPQVQAFVKGLDFAGGVVQAPGRLRVIGDPVSVVGLLAQSR